VKESENGRLVQFERGQTVGAHLAEACDKNCHIIMCIDSASPESKAILAYMNHGKTTSVKRNSGRKSVMTERDCCTLRIVSKNHRLTAEQVTAELNIHLEHPVSTETV
jgi:hypothetical protein